MAPPNGVPPTTQDGVYNSTTTSTPPTQNGEQHTQQTNTTCENCKQNQKGDNAANGEPPNNNIMQKKKNGELRSTKPIPQMEKEEEVQEEAEIVVPPDGGWGWVVAFASFMCNMMVDGITFSFGMFLPHIAESFGASKAKVAFVGSLLSGFYLLAGPFVSALANRFGFRSVTIVGSILSAGAFVLSYFATSVEFLYVSYGFLGGVGFGLIYVPAVVAVGFYFEKWRALATGIAVCGSGIGTFVLAPIFASLVESIGWRQTLFVQSVMALTCIIFGTLFRPVKPTKVPIAELEKEEVERDPETKAPLMDQINLTDMHMHKSTTSIASINKTHYPTVKEQWSKSISSLNKSTHSLNKRHSVHPITEENGALMTDENHAQIMANRRNSLKRQRTTSDCESGHRSRRGTMSGADAARPMYRDDIFFGGSLARLPQYQSHTSIGYTMSVTRLPTQNDIEEEEKEGCKLCPESMRRTLATMMDFSLFKSPSFVLIALSGGFTMMGFYVPFMYLTDRAMLSGIEEGTAMWLISAIGICNTIGRIVCGLISSHPKVNTLWVNNIAISLGGIVTIASGISMSQEYQFLYSCLFGLSISCFASLRSILLVDLVGLENLTNAFGLCLLFQGVAAAIGSPMAGAFMDATGSYDASFYLSGSLILISGLMCFPLARIKRWEDERARAAGIV